jgi:hypothetical protein
MRRNELFAGDLRHRGQHSAIANAPPPQLSLDHLMPLSGEPIVAGQIRHHFGLA